MKNRHLLIITLMGLLLWSCKDDVTDLPDEPTPPSTGFVSGKINSGNGLRPVGGALVFIMEGEDLHYTHSDAEGNFHFEAPSGSRTLHIQTGDGSNFRTALIIEVVEDQTINVPEAETRLAQVANIAYVPGAFDQIQILIDALGYTATELQYADLENYGSISPYDILFLNCGTETTNSLIDGNLASFVTNGGSLYTSDYAVTYLLGGMGDGNCMNPGGFIPDETLCTNRLGNVGSILSAEVSDAALAAALGYDILDIEYDLPQWEMIQNVDPAYWDILINDPDMGHGPLMVRTSSFSDPALETEPVGDTQDGWITICHYPPGNLDNPITITINESAWAAHEAHGDSVGPCDSAGGGTIYYTTFHTHAGGLNDDDSESILEYIILTL
jgi:hypothetical protein